MYSSVTTAQVQPDKLDECIRIYAEAALGAAQQTHDLKSVQLLTDRGTGKVMIVGTWETEAAARAWETNAYAQASLARLQSLIAVPANVTREYYDISFEHKYTD